MDIDIHEPGLEQYPKSSAVINRKKTCAKCKMRLICPGRAAKTT
jgi:radical SAM protein with 4Fe4S-binding SPASM domain